MYRANDEASGGEKLDKLCACIAWSKEHKNQLEKMGLPRCKVVVVVVLLSVWGWDSCCHLKTARPGPMILQRQRWGNFMYVHWMGNQICWDARASGRISSFSSWAGSMWKRTDGLNSCKLPRYTNSSIPWTFQAISPNSANSSTPPNNCTELRPLQMSGVLNSLVVSIHWLKPYGKAYDSPLTFLRF